MPHPRKPDPMVASRQPILFLHANGKVSRRLPLPFKTRARLRLRHHIDGIAAWLCGHGLQALAVGLWRACRMW